MATAKEINDAVLLNSIINNRAYGYDSRIAAIRDNAKWAELGGQARFDALMRDPQIYAHIAAGSGNSLVSTIKTAAPYVAAGLAAYYAVGALAGSAAPAGATSAAAQTATVAADVGAAATGAGQAQTFAQALTAAQAETAALLSTAPVSSATLLASVSPTAGAVAAETAALAASNAAMLATPLTDAAIAGVGTAGASSGAGVLSTAESFKEAIDVSTIFQDISGTVTDIGSTVSSIYGTVTGTQIQMAQLDLAKTQARAAMNQTPVFLQNDSGAIDWQMVALAAVGLLGLAFVAKRLI